MCGNVGLYGALTDVDKEMFRTLLVLDTTRGKHGTGIINVYEDFGYSWFKSVGTPSLLHMQDKVYAGSNPDYKPFFNASGLVEGPTRCLIGHNRHATAGKVATETAHPFNFDNVIGVHNGTLRLHGCDLDFKKDFEVDSEVLYANINQSSVPDVYKNVMGAMACVMWDKRDNTLNIWRNEERTLFGLKSVSGDKIMWASEEWMIFETIHTFNQEEVWEQKVKAWNPDTLFKVTFVDGQVTFDTTKMEAKKTFTNFPRPGTNTGRQVSTPATNFPPQANKGNCVYGLEKANKELGFYSWEPAKKAFVHIPYVNNKMDLPDTKYLPNGMVCFWEQVTSEHEYYFPLDGSATPSMIENFTKEPLLLENKEGNAEKNDDSTATKLVMSGDEAKFILESLVKTPTQKGNLDPKDWIKVFAEKDKAGKKYVNISFRFKGSTYYCEKTILPFIVYSKSNFWLSTRPVVSRSSLDITRSGIDPEYRSYEGVGYEISQGFNNEESATSDLFDVDGDLLNFDELQSLIKQAGGGCYSCSSTPIPSEYETLTWVAHKNVTGDYDFLCQDCAKWYNVKRA